MFNLKDLSIVRDFFYFGVASFVERNFQWGYKIFRVAKIFDAVTKFFDTRKKFDG